MLNDLDRFHLVIDVIDRVPGLAAEGGAPAAGDGRPAAGGAGVDARARRRRPGDPGLDLAALSRSDPRRQRRLDEPQALRRRRKRSARPSVRRLRRRPTPSGTGSSTSATCFVEAALVDDWLIPHDRGGRGGRTASQPSPPSTRSGARSRRLPNLPHVAVSDSYFHRTMPDYVRSTQSRADWTRRSPAHGFHGLAVGSIAERLSVPRLVVCHLGGGAL